MTRSEFEKLVSEEKFIEYTQCTPAPLISLVLDRVCWTECVDGSFE